MKDQDKTKEQLISELVEMRQRITELEAERKQAEKALRESEEKYRSVIENANVGIVVIQDGRLVFHNSKMNEMLGFTGEEFSNIDFSSVIHPEDRSYAVDRIGQRLTGIATDSSVTEMRVVSKSGDIKWVEANSATTQWEGKPAIQAFVANITERKRAEKTLRESEALLNKSQAIAHVGSWEMDLVADRLTWSDEVYRIFGLRPQEFDATYEAFLDIVHPDDRAAVDAAYSESLREGRDTYEIEHRIVRQDNGKVRVVHEKCEHIRDTSGRIVRSIGMVHDITERKWVEETLRQYTAELEARNEELDAYAHTVAHDLKNPLAYVVGFAEVLEKDYALLPVGELRRYLHMMAQNGRKMSNIIDELLLLASVRKVDEVPLELLDMASIVGEAQERLSHIVEEYQAEIILPDAWPEVLGYGPWVEEVWVNYLSNAIKYGGQPPHVELGFETVDDEHGRVRFWVRDNGPGLTPEEQERLFKSFELLDQVRAKGHGLGLSIVRRIVEKLGGQVGVESVVGQGSKFYFTLPAISD